MNEEVLENQNENVEETNEETNQQGIQGLGDDESDAGDKPTDDAEQNKEKDDDGIYGAPENFDYSKIELPDGMTLDAELIEEFNPLAKKYNLSNQSANELLNLAVKMQTKNMAKIGEIASEIQANEKNSYLQLLNTDKELNQKTAEEYSQYLSTANLGVKSFATAGFKQLIKEKGLVNHPEVIKTFNAIGKLCQQDKIPDADKPVGKKLDPADILYGKKDND